VSTPPARRLRDFQADDIERVRAAWARGVTRPALVWATGLGKTDPIARIATEDAAHGAHVLILAHRGELLDQLRDRCQIYDPTIAVGRVQAGSREHDAPIVVATVQTYARLVAANSPRLRRPDLVIVDEAHHAAAMTYERIMRWAGCYEGEEALDADGLPVPVEPTRALGVTATMDRESVGGRIGLGNVWQEVVAERGIVWGIEHGPDPADPWTTLPVGADEGCVPAGWLVPLTGRVVVGEHVDLSRAKINKTTGDYADGDLGDMVAQDAPQVVKDWWEHARLPDGSHRQTGVFVPTIEAAYAYADAFAAAGVATKVVTGRTAAAVRGDVYRRTGIYGELADGRITVIVSVGVLTEGWDCPPVSCILVARPTQLDRVYQQIVGRGTRPMDLEQWPRWDGGRFYPKHDCLILDVVGATRVVGLRTLVHLVPGAPYVGRPCAVCAQPRPCGCVAADPADTGAEDYPVGPGAPRIDNRRRLIGPAEYEPFDPLADARSSGLNWLRTIPQAGYEGIPFLRAGDYYGILWHNEDDTWSGGWVTARGPHDGEWTIESVTEREARAHVEAIRIPDAHGGGLTELADLAERADAPFRRARKSPSARQLDYARNLGIVEPERLTAGACSDEIERARATARLTAAF
jgi:superfamily II DNA or RNA helicase